MNSYLIQEDDAQQFVFYWYYSHGQAKVRPQIGLVKNVILRGDARVPARLKQED